MINAEIDRMLQDEENETSEPKVDGMDEAINILKQELKWSEEHKDECPHGEKYCGGYIEGIRQSITVLQMAKQASA